MRIFNRSHVPWFMFVLLATVAACSIYVGNVHPERLPHGFSLPPWLIHKPSDHRSIGGTPLGLVLGTISLGIFVFAALLGVRKKLPFLPVGNVQRWLRAHIWLTLLTIPLILLHSGFRLGSPMTTTLMVLYAVVMVSGIYGLILQHKLPTMMKESLPAEIVFEQIPNVRAQLCAAAEKLQRSLKQQATSGSAVVATDVSQEEVLAGFIEQRLLPYLRARRGEKYRLGHAREADEIFRHLKLRVDEMYREGVDDMRRWCDERRLTDAQLRMQHWLHSWLFVHVPLSFLLLLMTVWHAFVTLFRY
jgi:predicted membrane channel-forming protein YqfA (hemolysin III family)